MPSSALTLALLAALLTIGSVPAPQPPSGEPEPASQEDPVTATAEAVVDETDPAAELFLIRCSGCHTVGRGKLTGPDLQASTAWPEADLAAGIVKMVPKTGALGTDEVQSLVSLLKDADLGGRLSREESRIAQRFAAKLEPASADEGRDLFRGERPLKNHGMACTACHRAGAVGGNLGPDLTGVFAKLGRLGLVSATEGANFPVMRTAYRDHRVTQQEALHIAAHLESLAGEAPAEPRQSAVLVLGLVLAAAAMGLVTLTFRNPRRGVRARLVREANRS